MQVLFAAAALSALVEDDSVVDLPSGDHLAGFFESALAWAKALPGVGADGVAVEWDAVDLRRRGMKGMKHVAEYLNFALVLCSSAQRFPMSLPLSSACADGRDAARATFITLAAANLSWLAPEAAAAPAFKEDILSLYSAARLANATLLPDDPDEAAAAAALAALVEAAAPVVEAQLPTRGLWQRIAFANALSAAPGPAAAAAGAAAAAAAAADVAAQSVIRRGANISVAAEGGVMAAYAYTHEVYSSTDFGRNPLNGSYFASEDVAAAVRIGADLLRQLEPAVDAAIAGAAPSGAPEAVEGVVAVDIHCEVLLALLLLREEFSADVEARVEAAVHNLWDSFLAPRSPRSGEGEAEQQYQIAPYSVAMPPRACAVRADSPAVAAKKRTSPEYSAAIGGELHCVLMCSHAFTAFLAHRDTFDAVESDRLLSKWQQLDEERSAKGLVLGLDGVWKSKDAYAAELAEYRQFVMENSGHSYSANVQLGNKPHAEEAAGDDDEDEVDEEI